MVSVLAAVVAEETFGVLASHFALVEIRQEFQQDFHR